MFTVFFRSNAFLVISHAVTSGVHVKVPLERRMIKTREITTAALLPAWHNNPNNNNNATLGIKQTTTWPGLQLLTNMTAINILLGRRRLLA